MDLISQGFDWLTDPAHWTGSEAIPTRVQEHLILSGASVLAALLIAMPLGLVIGHTRRGEFLVVTIANVGRSLPSFALLVMIFPLVLALGGGLGFWPTFVPLVLLAIPPILTNSAVAIREVDADMVEAARGMGMSGSGVLRRVELPLALPLIFAGVRVASVQVIATATIGAIVASGGLGRYIIDGFALQDDGRLVAGAFLVAVLALVAERGFGLLERLATSPGLRRTASSMQGRATYS